MEMYKAFLFVSHDLSPYTGTMSSSITYSYNHTMHPNPMKIIHMVGQNVLTKKSNMVNLTLAFSRQLGKISSFFFSIAYNI
jgi:hypothetical protein